MPTLCLNMIVKNESKIIRRALASVAHLIDYWLICDTGSTDNTVACIQAFFAERNIPGELHSVEWQNFGHNRTQALQLAQSKADYLLFMDADMELVDDGFSKAQLQQPHYSIRQYNGTLVYYNTRLVATRVNWQVLGVTHEYYQPEHGQIPPHKLESLYFIDHTDGGCKADKFTRDIALLLAGLRAEPDNNRYKFYLANSYKDSGDNTNAVKWYESRIQGGGWDEEVYYAHYMKMLCQYRAHYPFSLWLHTGLEAFAYRPQRLEALYEIVKYCRENAHYLLAYQLGKAQENLPFPSDVLFVDQAIHEWKFFDELAVCAYWAGDLDLSARLLNRLLREKKYPPHEQERLLKNLAFSAPQTNAVPQTILAAGTQPSTYLVNIAGKPRTFYFRDSSLGDKGVIEQIFTRCDYGITHWQSHNQALLALMDAHGVNGRLPFILDAGANIGASAVWFAQTYHPGLVYAIEPEPNNCNLLRLNTEGLNVSVYEAAIGSHAGELFLQDPMLSDWGFRVGKTGTKKVPVISAETLIHSVDFTKYFPFIAKIDIEGGEADLFAEHNGWLDSFALVIIELHDWMLPFSGSSRPFMQALTRYDFDILHHGENIFCFNRRLLLPSFSELK
ncbi:MAG: FkbM family methyltransferase [Methylovulum sp.]|nr:FkbM family methyltransferase [Methylovulum sp.]